MTKKYENKQRLVSLDVLRGFDMFWIIGGSAVIQNIADLFGPRYGEVVKRQLTHAPWEGFRGYDLIMPLFLFMVGCSMVFSLNRRKRQTEGLAAIYRHIFTRSIILFLLGWLLQGNLHLLQWERVIFFNNTLQAIAAGYLLSAICLLHCGLRGRILTWIALLLAYWAILSFVPGPDFPAGSLSEQHNMAIFLDKKILGVHQGGSAYSWILSTLTFTASVLAGAFAGQLLTGGTHPFFKMSGLFAAGALLTWLGWLWGTHNFPIIKYIWTSSMVLYASGLSSLLLGGFYLIVDMLHIRKPFFLFQVIGMNALFAYVAWNLVGQRIFHRIIDLFLNPFLAPNNPLNLLINAFCSFTMFWLILYFLYRKKIFIKL
jgi:predicted acyltransferase